MLAIEPVIQSIRRNIQPARVDHSPRDLIHRDFLERADRFVTIKLFASASHGVDEIPERVALGALDMPGAFERLDVNLAQLRIGFIVEQWIIRQESQFVIRMVNAARVVNLQIARQQVVAVFGDQLVVSLLVAQIAGDVTGDAQVREDVQRAQPRLVRVDPDLLRPPPPPSRALAVRVDQLIVVVKNVVGHPRDDAADLSLLGLVRDQVVINRVAEIMADDLVRAGVALPTPFAVGRVMPFAVLRLDVFADLDERSRVEAGNARDLFQPQHRLEALPGVGPRVGLARDLVAKGLSRDVHLRPQSVVVARDGLVGRKVARSLQDRIGGQSVADVARADALDEGFRFLGERHFFIFDTAEAFGRFDPDNACFYGRFKSDAGDVIVGHAAAPRQVAANILREFVVDNHAASRADPYNRGLVVNDHSDFIARQLGGARIRTQRAVSMASHDAAWRADQLAADVTQRGVAVDFYFAFGKTVEIIRRMERASHL